MENQDQKTLPVEQPPIVIGAIDAIKLDLEVGDTLAMVVKSDDVTAELMAHLKTNLAQMFPDVRVLIFGVGASESIDFAVIKQAAAEAPKSSCNTGNYCADCSCGKKEQYEKQN